ncbi:tetratricopeptide repeat protein [Nocardioides albus]|uniref:Tetratricopeptide (TPR) repeat protein n=1 Tax=Nocardioides albus TaxID=1841 RepID=A0A7W5A907_9ACTN|nr:tetratricopeptide repeat protein [Nocardioides albus]MBB3091903.1 tetratricopeptide (TPR) repeat protein [Nocardioides albus]GGU32911.1 hypothetical protein GCM10007979_34820 [Nocardioides albus]
MYTLGDRMWKSSKDDARTDIVANLQRITRLESWLAGHGLRRLKPRVAGLMLQLSRYYSELGRVDEAAEHARLAVQHYARLAEHDPEKYLPLLARAQIHAGWILWPQSQDDAALAFSQQAVDSCRRLAAAEPDMYAASLANAHHLLGMRLSDVARYEDAIVAEKEALLLLNPLAKADFDAHGLDLARLLYLLGETYAEMDRKVEALDAHRRATDLWARAAVADPDQYEASLGAQLRDLGLEYSALKRYEEAAEVNERSAEIRRRLAEDDLVEHGHDLAFTLHNLGCFYFLLGRPEDALPVAQEAVDLYRRLVAAPPDPQEPDRERELVRLLEVLSNRLARVGHLEAAFETGQEALRLARERVRTDQQHAETSLVVVLRTVAQRHHDLGRCEEAVPFEVEADEISDRLEADDLR